jgi:hypothetical protein
MESSRTEVEFYVERSRTYQFIALQVFGDLPSMTIHCDFLSGYRLSRHCQLSLRGREVMRGFPDDERI